MEIINFDLPEKPTGSIGSFKMIERGIQGISAKMLSKELKELEINELVTRTIQDTRPITVTYALTDYGKSVIPVIEALVQWGFDHRMMIKKTR